MEIGGFLSRQTVRQSRHWRADDVADAGAFSPGCDRPHPKVVVILAGTNDIAGNTGPIRNEDIEENLASIADLAHANSIAVVFSSVLPVHNYAERSKDFFAQRSQSRILDLNTWLKDYSSKNKIVYLDYFSAMVDDKGMLKQELADDGLHPNAAGLGSWLRWRKPRLRRR